jgi:hypothetical protein
MYFVSTDAGGMMSGNFHPRLAIAALAFVSCFVFPNRAHAGLLGPGNHPECVLSRMPGAANDTIAYQIAAQCFREFPSNTPVKTKTGMFSAFNSGAECTLKKAKDTPSSLAARIIQAACFALYEPQTFVDPFAAGLVPKKP